LWCITEMVRGTHAFEISGYNLLKGLGIGNFIRSTTFAVSGHDRGIRFYPDTIAREDGVSAYVGVYLQFMMEKDMGVMVRALCTVSLVDQTTGPPSPIVSLDAPKVFSWNTKFWGNPKFMKKSTLEASSYLKNDCLVIECCVTVIKGPLVQEAMVASGFKIQVPPSDLSENLGKLLESGGDRCDIQGCGRR
jgi:speckle-type POZ protein